MSQPVELGALVDCIDEYGPTAFLVTVNDDGTAHVVSVTVAVDGDHLVASVGNRTRANAHVRPTVTLVWPPRPNPAYSLIVDAEHVPGGGNADTSIAVEPHSAVLHRVAGASGEGPTCLPVE
jgi:hypothetical protein